MILAGPITNQLTLADPLYFSWFVVCVLIVVLTAYLSPRFGFNKLRRVAALDGLDEIVKSCAERGRPVLYSPTGTKLGQPHLVAAMEAGKLVAKTCADLNVRLYTLAVDPEQYLLFVDYVRQGCMESTHPERWNPSDHLFVPDYGAAVSLPTSCMEMVEGRNIGGSIYFGGITWNTFLNVVEHGLRHGCLQFTAFYWPDDISQAVMFSDYCTITDEMVAAGAYLGRDPVDAAFVVGSDLMKIFIAVVMVALAIKTALGV